MNDAFLPLAALVRGERSAKDLSGFSDRWGL